MKHEKLARKIKGLLKEEDINLSLKEVCKVLEAFIDVVKTDVLNGEKIMIKNFGTFKPKDVEGGKRKIGNKEVEIKSFRTIVFKPSKYLRKYL